MNSRNFVQPRSNGSRPIRVLMADPDESLPPVYREPLSREGFELATASSGLECVARLRERVPDVLVLEPQLPWGGGDGVLAMMGEVPQLATVPVMVLTSCRDPRVLKRVARFPISDYQLKPLAPDRLAGRLRSLLAHPKLRFTLAEQTGRLECSMAASDCVRTCGRVTCAAAPTRTTSSSWRPLRKRRSPQPKGSSWTLKCTMAKAGNQSESITIHKGQRKS